MIYKLLKNLLKYAGYEGWSRDEGFFSNCFYLIRLNTRKWFILTYNRMFEIIKVSTIWQFDLDDMKPANLLIYIFHIEVFMSLCAS